MRRIRTTTQARQDLVELHADIAGKRGEALADDYLQLIASSVASLARWPGNGRARDALVAGYGSLPVNHHVVFYTAAADEIVVVRVLHASMDLTDYR